MNICTHISICVLINIQQLMNQARKTELPRKRNKSTTPKNEACFLLQSDGLKLQPRSEPKAQDLSGSAPQTLSPQRQTSLTQISFPGRMRQCPDLIFKIHELTGNWGQSVEKPSSTPLPLRPGSTGSNFRASDSLTQEYELILAPLKDKMINSLSLEALRDADGTVLETQRSFGDMVSELNYINYHWM